MPRITCRRDDRRRMCVRRLNAVPALWSLSLSSLSGERDHQTPNSEQTGRIQGLAAIIGAIARHEVDAIVVQSLHHLGTSVDSLLETLAALHRHGVKLVVHDHADAVETGGLLAAADLLVEARRAYRREKIVAGQLRARASGVRFGRPPVPSGRLEKVRVALRKARVCAKRLVPVGSVQPRRRGSKPRWLSPSS